MSHLNTEAYLRARGVINDTRIDRDLACRECGYNLRGLEYGGKCPECGSTIHRKMPVYEHLMDAPLPYLKTLRLGMGLVCLGLWAPIIGQLLLAITSASGSTTASMSVRLAGTLIFVAGGWIVTRPKPHEQTMGRAWYHIANMTRAAIIVSPALTLAYSFLATTAFGGLLDWLSDLAIYAELCLLALCLDDLAKWVHDDDVGKGFEFLTGMFGLFFVAELILGFFSRSVATFGCIGGLFVFGSVIWFMISVLRLYGTIHRAVIDKPRHDSSVFRNPRKEIR